MTARTTARCYRPHTHHAILALASLVCRGFVTISRFLGTCIWLEEIPGSMRNRVNHRQTRTNSALELLMLLLMCEPLHSFDEQVSIWLRSRRLNAMPQIHDMASISSLSKNLFSSAHNELRRTITENLGIKVALQSNVCIASFGQLLFGLAQVDRVIDTDHIRTGASKRLQKLPFTRVGIGRHVNYNWDTRSALFDRSDHPLLIRGCPLVELGRLEVARPRVEHLDHLCS
mmetsp:Transcript_30444/g.63837  ORF Transcript_30444/g.63837 Transcript_30444/m.63837 type:complete len:230 (-) Transcript_30444:802-1491(-)